MSTPLLTPPGAEELPPLLLTVEQAARLLAIGRTALYHLIWDGQDPNAIDVGQQQALIDAAQPAQGGVERLRRGLCHAPIVT